MILERVVAEEIYEGLSIEVPFSPLVRVHQVVDSPPHRLAYGHPDVRHPWALVLEAEVGEVGADPTDEGDVHCVPFKHTLELLGHFRFFAFEHSEAVAGERGAVSWMGAKAAG